MCEGLTNIFENFWSWRLENFPEFATAVGKHERDDELDDYSLKEYEKRLKDVKGFIKELDKIKVNQLSKENKLSFELLNLELATFVEGSKHNSNLFPINALEGPQLELARTVSWMKQKTVSDLEKILSRYDKFPAQADQFIELLKKGVETGNVNAKVSMEGVPGQIQTLLKTPAKQSSFYEPFKEQENDKLKETALKAIEKKLYPAFEKLYEYIKETYFPACRDEISCTALPTGEAFYKAALYFHLSVNKTAEEIHDVGLKEVERIKGRMHEVMKEVEFQGTIEEFFHFLKTDRQFYCDKKEDFLAAYHTTCDRIKKLLPTYFGIIPKADVVIKEVPAEGAANAPGAFYYAGSEDGSRPGTFFVNTYQFEKRPNYEFCNLALHEANPGHHLQATLAIEQKDLPNFRRFFEDRHYYEVPGRFALNTAFLEGWGLYSEYLGEEMDVYTTPYDLFGRLSAEMFRACRLVVDTGMHKKGWSREDAKKFMRDNTAMSEVDISAEIDRYITWPGQACAYKIGEIKLRELRTKAQKQLGNKFDVKSFHDAILTQGAVPLAILEEIVDEFIEKNR